MSNRFSIIVPCYNNSEYLQCCIGSILGQDYDNIEIIIADDKSLNFDKDYYVEYIQKNNNGNIKKILVYQNPENYGTVKNLNCAIKKATGSYIKLLAADDSFYDNNVLSKVQVALQSCSNGILICDVMTCNSNMEALGKHTAKLIRSINDLSPQECFSRLCIRNNIKAVGVFFRSDFFIKYGLFNEKYRLLEDWPTWLMVTQKGGSFWYEPIMAVNYRTTSGVVANNNPYYLADRRRVFTDIIKPVKKQLSFRTYVLAKVLAYCSTWIWIRKAYSVFHSLKRKLLQI